MVSLPSRPLLLLSHYENWVTPYFVLLDEWTDYVFPPPSFVHYTLTTKLSRSTLGGRRRPPERWQSDTFVLIRAITILQVNRGWKVQLGRTLWSRDPSTWWERGGLVFGCDTCVCVCLPVGRRPFCPLKGTIPSTCIDEKLKPSPAQNSQELHVVDQAEEREEEQTVSLCFKSVLN